MEDLKLFTLHCTLVKNAYRFRNIPEVEAALPKVGAYHLLKDNTEILNELRSKITHIMVDEYQDTNFIQEQLVFLLAGKHKNICVVGDDDQGLYRFRGATIRNILEFPQKFEDGECRIIPLVINYRSNSDIVDFYNKWMATTDGAKFKFHWQNSRYDKKKDTEELQHQCDKENDWAFCKEQFLKAVRKFMEMKTLTPTILHELVERINVYQTQGRGKNRMQRIVIHYNFIGVLDDKVQ